MQTRKKEASNQKENVAPQKSKVVEKEDKKSVSRKGYPANKKSKKSKKVVNPIKEADKIQN